jgi:hypothetical protein
MVSELICVGVVKACRRTIDIGFIVIDVWVPLNCEVGISCKEVPVPS